MTTRSSSSSIRKAVFSLGVAVAVAAAIVIGMDTPEVPDQTESAEFVQTDDFDSLIDVAFDDYEANDALTDSAPQQQVVNGWIARDMLRIISLQNEAVADTIDAMAAMQAADPPDDRPIRLLVVAILLVAWIGLWVVLLRPGDGGNVVDQRVAEGAQSPATTPMSALDG